MAVIDERHYFSSLATELAERSASGLIGALAPVSAPLRARLRELLDVAPGESGSFLADPVFEGVFGWQHAPETMATLATAGLLSTRLVRAMATPSSDPALREHAFPRDRLPYTHQVEAWRRLQVSPSRSVIVTSGTGSGKTECFLVPILDDLAREAEHAGRLEGVRALFLYPLNALINSQRDRLRAWCEPFKGDLRFCLYKGDTPEGLPASQTTRPEEVLDRKTLRDSPPPLLITNSTMLEYMLVRKRDAPIVAHSRGQLRWVVLDEAHSYVGSAAAELSLLLRRVLHSFEVAAENVRFIATSATIGTGGEQARERLRSFLADLAGVPEDRVDVVEEQRRIPGLAEHYQDRQDDLPSLAILEQLPVESLFDVLARNAGTRRLREGLLRSKAVSLSALTRARTGQAAPSSLPVTCEERNVTLRLLDLGTVARCGQELFLQLRAHFFHRAHGGIWACISRECSGRNGSLSDPMWAFGAIYLERRSHCMACDSLVFELVLCGECGIEYLAADLVTDDGSFRYRARVTTADRSEAEEYSELVGEDETEEPPDDMQTAPEGWPRLLTSAGLPEVRDVRLDPRSGREIATGEGTLLGELSSLGGTNGAVRCLRCGTSERVPEELFRPSRRGAPFFLRSTIPILLDYVPPETHPGERRPYEGRKIITFTDSRQGTARFSLNTQLDSERNYVRSFIYHQLIAARANVGVNRQQLLAEIEALEGAAAAHPALQSLLETKRTALAALSSVGRLSWKALEDRLAETTEIKSWMLEHWHNFPLRDLTRNEAARFCILREFVRRPKRQNNLETLGFVALHYPRLDTVQRTPPPWSQRNLGEAEWRAFLKVCLDFLVRSRTAVQVNPVFVDWMGAPVHPRVVTGPEAVLLTPTIIRWPRASFLSRRNRLVQLLARVLHLDLERAESFPDLNICLDAAWHAIRPLLSQQQEGWNLELHREADFVEIRDAWLCPVTHRVLDTTVSSLTPYLTPDLPTDEARCRTIRMPELPHAFWRRDDGSRFTRQEIENWLQKSEVVRSLVREGVWSDLSSRLASSAAYFQVAEHSAQQSPQRLRKYEQKFKEGRINILSCSTTMELGVDIGGLVAVAMNNAPPGPANFLQRAGRAGRRGEARAFSFTLCKNTPHGEAIFRTPMWAFDTPIFVSRVSLSSERIVQRHVNSLALTRFLEQKGGKGDGMTLECGPFFEGPAEARRSPCELFTRWLEEEALRDSWVLSGVRKLIARSCLAGAEPDRLLGRAATQIEGVRAAWLAEKEPLEQDLARLGDDEADGAVRKAISYQLDRMRGEYLLRDLATRSFLPGYGFPTGVVPFVTTTVGDFPRRPHTREHSREEDFLRSRGYPSRDLAMGLREYAPGATVVIDGRVLHSAGLTLNWKAPANDGQIREIQAIGTAWRCRSCGQTGTSRARPDRCPSSACARDQTRLDLHQYLRPSGFAVDIAERPSNDLTRNTYLPVDDPWVSMPNTPWTSLPEPRLGRYRYSPDGQLFLRSKGLHGHGYAVCLQCGRAAPEEARQPAPKPRDLQDHRPLRGGRARNATGTCVGNDDPWKVQRNIWLGEARTTDLFELQLSDPATGRTRRDDVALSSLAVALRGALSQVLGVEDREIGWATTVTRADEDEEPTRSIILYDTASGGAGFCSHAPRALPSVFERARDNLTCPRKCDSSCHGCLLAYDTQHFVEKLNRHSALAMLTPEVLEGLRRDQA